MDKLHEIFTKEYLTKIEAINLAISRKMNSGYSGARKSNSKGNSLEFADFRTYTPGDDVRRIDWKGYSRFNKLFVKQFDEEKQATINIFLDTSKSMDFGEKNKFFFAKALTATIVYLAIKNTDKVNIFCLNKKLSLTKTNIVSKNLFPSVISFLDDLKAEEETYLSKAIEDIKGFPLNSGISFVISDFFSKDGYESMLKFLQNKKQDVYFIQILSDEELKPELSGAIRLVDSENKKSKDLMITPELKKRYDKALVLFKNEIVEFCKKRGATYVFSNSSSNILKLIYEEFTPYRL